MTRTISRQSNYALHELRAITKAYSELSTIRSYRAIDYVSNAVSQTQLLLCRISVGAGNLVTADETFQISNSILTDTRRLNKEKRNEMKFH